MKKKTMYRLVMSVPLTAIITMMTYEHGILGGMFTFLALIATFGFCIGLVEIIERFGKEDE